MASAMAIGIVVCMAMMAMMVNDVAAREVPPGWRMLDDRPLPPRHLMRLTLALKQRNLDRFEVCRACLL